MDITRYTPAPVPFEASPNLRAWLDEQVRRLAVLVNNSVQLEEFSKLDINDNQLSDNVALLNRSPQIFTGLNTFSENLLVSNPTDAITDTKILTVESNGFAGLIISGDASNTSGEPGGSFIDLRRDGGISALFVSTPQNAGDDGQGGSFTGSSANAGLIAHKHGNPLEFGTNGAVRLRISSAGNTVIVGGQSLYISERASAGGNSAGHGQLWTRSSDGKLMFTSASGTTTALT